MRRLWKFFPYLCLLFFLSVAACVKLPPPVSSLSEANQKFLKICREEYQYPVTLYQQPRTLWVYLPVADEILNVKALDDGPSKSADSSLSLSILYLNAQFSDGNFQISYDIEKTKKYAESLGYGSAYSEDLRARQSNILQAVARAYSDLGTVPGDVTYQDPAKNETHKKLVESYVQPEQPPEFFVLVWADIKRGIAIEAIVNFRDLKRAYANPPELSQDEYTKRYVNRIYGSKYLLGDSEGKSLKIRDITWPEFLSRQIESRVKFKYQTSSFPPGENTEEEILKLVTETVRAYGFRDFVGVELKNLADGKSYLVNQTEIQ